MNPYFFRILRVIFIIASSLLFGACKEENFVFTGSLKLDHYPSASGIESLDGKIYVIGDDAKYVLILDSNLAPVDSIPLYDYAGKKIPKDIKPDLEAISVVKEKGVQKLLITGSGSLSPYRDIGWLINPLTKQKDSIRLDTLYYRMKAAGLQELNIEGSCMIPGALVLTNRGSKGYPKNHLIIANDKCWNNQAQTPLSIIRIGTGTDTSVFNGISGMTYSYKTDRLILTVSTEDTRNSFEDGAIGKSYLYIIRNISSRKRWKAINPDQVIDLETADPVFRGQKIESVCITKETRQFLHLVLAADNDNGSSTLFKLVVEKD
jgi:hypothetical protein